MNPTLNKVAIQPAVVVAFTAGQSVAESIDWNYLCFTGRNERVGLITPDDAFIGGTKLK